MGGTRRIESLTAGLQKYIRMLESISDTFSDKLSSPIAFPARLTQSYRLLRSSIFFGTPRHLDLLDEEQS